MCVCVCVCVYRLERARSGDDPPCRGTVTARQANGIIEIFQVPASLSSRRVKVRGKNARYAW